MSWFGRFKHGLDIRARWYGSMWPGRWRVLKSLKKFDALALNLIVPAAIQIVTGSVGRRVVRPVKQVLATHGC